MFGLGEKVLAVGGRLRQSRLILKVVLVLETASDVYWGRRSRGAVWHDDGVHLKSVQLVEVGESLEADEEC